MTILTFKRSMTLFIIVFLTFTLGVTTSISQQKIKISGKITVTQTQVDSINVGDTEGHLISLGMGEGANANTGDHKFMDGAMVVNMYFSDLTKGNGKHQGYIKMESQKSSVFGKWEGAVATTVSSEGTPNITFKGKYTYINGTGKFENIEGSGTYKGYFVSENKYVSDWEGEYLIKK